MESGLNSDCPSTIHIEYHVNNINIIEYNRDTIRWTINYVEKNGNLN